MRNPEVSVVVPSHGRRLRLWWLLNGLEEQSLAHDRFEVIVVHDYTDPDFLADLERHPLAVDQGLRLIAIEPGSGRPSRQRNLGWRAARAPLVAFTDDDCRPLASWLERLLEAADEHPGGILQGVTRPDPLEEQVFAAPHHRSLFVDPPSVYAQTCNIAYPRDLLERVGGFDEAMTTGEDTDLALRAKAAGGVQFGAPEAVVHHAVESFSLPEFVRMTAKWGHLPLVLRRHPSLRSETFLRVFWRPSHFEMLLALAALALCRRNRLAALLAGPYLRRALTSRGLGRRALLAAAVELPGRALVDCAEVAIMVRGSVRYRTPLL